MTINYMPVLNQNALMMSGENDNRSMDHQQNYLVTIAKEFYHEKSRIFKVKSLTKNTFVSIQKSLFWQALLAIDRGSQ